MQLFNKCRKALQAMCTVFFWSPGFRLLCLFFISVIVQGLMNVVLDKSPDVEKGLAVTNVDLHCWPALDLALLSVFVLAVKHPRGEHLAGRPVWMGHVGKGELTRNVCFEALLWAGPRGRVRHHNRLQHPRTAQLAPEDVRLQVYTRIGVT